MLANRADHRYQKVAIIPLKSGAIADNVKILKAGVKRKLFNPFLSPPFLP